MKRHEMVRLAEKNIDAYGMDVARLDWAKELDAFL